MWKREWKRKKVNNYSGTLVIRPLINVKINGIQEMSEPQISYAIHEHDTVCILEIKEKRIDSLIAPAFKTELLRLIASDWKYILVNLENVDAIDSSGLGALTFGQRQLNEVNGSIALCCPKEKVATLFRISKLDRVFSIYDTSDEGLREIIR